MQLAGALHDGAGTASGGVLFTAVTCAVSVTVPAVVAGVTLAAAAALAHDVAACAVQRGRMSQAAGLLWTAYGGLSPSVGLQPGRRTRSFPMSTSTGSPCRCPG